MDGSPSLGSVDGLLYLEENSYSQFKVEDGRGSGGPPFCLESREKVVLFFITCDEVSFFSAAGRNA